MDFDFSDDQQALREAVAKWVEKSYDFERRQQIVKSGGFDRAVYNELAELGLTGIYVSEEYGGMSDPDEVFPIECPADINEGDACSVDGPVTGEGCCMGDTLVYCSQEQMLFFEACGE